MKNIRAFLLSPAGEKLLQWMEKDADRQIVIGIIVAFVFGGLLAMLF